MLLLAGCGPPGTGTPAEPEPPPPPLPVRPDISGRWEGRPAGTGTDEDWRLVISDGNGNLTGTFNVRCCGPTAEWPAQQQGALTGTASQPLAGGDQEVSISLSGNYTGTFTGTATGRSRLRGMIEYQRADESGVRGPFAITFTRASL